MCSDIAIRVDSLIKDYRIYTNPSDRLKQAIVPKLKRLVGKAPSSYFREFRALDDVSFEVYRGQTVGVIGRNGSGKSTLLQIICGTLTPSSGTVEVNGRVAALLELGAGFNPEFSGRENVYLFASVMGLSQAEVSERYDAILDFADIGEFIDQPVKTYSSGMLVRLAFAVIAHVDADILVIDEALAVGDAFFVQKCMRFLRKFMEHGTVLFVSHDSAAVTNLCNYAVWLEKGGVREKGEPKRVSEHYLEAQYGSEGNQQDAAATVQESDEDAIADDGNVPAFRETTKEGEARDFDEADDFHDMRRDLMLGSTLRNDLELFTFDPDAPGFGEKGGTVEQVTLSDRHGRNLNWVVGGESVVLTIECRAHQLLNSPIIGFIVKDRLGQTLFGDNTFLGTRPLSVQPGEAFRALFEFRMPILPMGQYSIGVALADGTQNDHRQHHWIHDALIVTSHASSLAHGLVGLPMRRIALESLAR
ncbi:ABC transporter ATP-binding protein [Halomonas sp. McH1-25]|uniref:ABC transporter ATP-binding protein n=1 Tax=unclassified Halomonas TaxID=2609666 RepID=UPI001EF49AA3|nr:MULTISPECIES: ABC transporter ATP-binding protein [unclassified Halomonas]MCG7600470.1 ABC transporter ATP-binding protein [Halomonas sp. McH1-25]MCP1342931.1 ABC transporter ATP-binding protein [Halomonas sp. FL8]MCP1359977.1 ABC transporter ATP-binding protein [Halomonas sp. BBD45]MCP1363899.1 ABC transporter ATP-binding protein [Halomonas sp. BBD48]